MNKKKIIIAASVVAAILLCIGIIAGILHSNSKKEMTQEKNNATLQIITRKDTALEGDFIDTETSTEASTETDSEMLDFDNGIDDESIEFNSDTSEEESTIIEEDSEEENSSLSDTEEADELNTENDFEEDENEIEIEESDDIYATHFTENNLDDSFNFGNLKINGNDFSINDIISGDQISILTDLTFEKKAENLNAKYIDFEGYEFISPDNKNSISIELINSSGKVASNLTKDTLSNNYVRGIDVSGCSKDFVITNDFLFIGANRTAVEEQLGEGYLDTDNTVYYQSHSWSVYITYNDKDVVNRFVIVAR